eukprot:TRINITY_DN55916_c0_g1_i1.p2 TRINITY_DN55916_c0_g1~~TRINITY_DN55916_c0_g1_i1.p2  ORF type:complete len:204 (+),score=32.50 TRINITY_DN55916_c0_g1_i1:80-691(+)
MPRMDESLVEGLRNGKEWEVGMFETPYKAPAKCCLGAACACCFAYKQRQDILEYTAEPYVCCGGLCPCGPLGDPCSKDRVPACLCLEVTCCPFMSVAANRYMLQTRFYVKNDPCDDCILCFQAALNCVALGLEISGQKRETAEQVKVFADCVNCSVMACMLAQQQVELEHAMEKPYEGANKNIIDLLPPNQQEMINFNPRRSS